MNDKKTTYDKLVKHIDKAQKFIDLLMQEKQLSVSESLEKAIADFVSEIGRHKAGLVLRGIANQYIEKDKLAQPVSAEEIHNKNVAAQEREEKRKQDFIDCQEFEKRVCRIAIDRLGFEKILSLLVYAEDDHNGFSYYRTDYKNIYEALSIDSKVNGSESDSEISNLIDSVNIPSVSLKYSSAAKEVYLGALKELGIND